MRSRTSRSIGCLPLEALASSEGAVTVTSLGGTAPSAPRSSLRRSLSPRGGSPGVGTYRAPQAAYASVASFAFRRSQVQRCRRWPDGMERDPPVCVMRGTHWPGLWIRHQRVDLHGEMPGREARSRGRLPHPIRLKRDDLRRGQRPSRLDRMGSPADQLRDWGLHAARVCALRDREQLGRRSTTPAGVIVLTFAGGGRAEPRHRLLRLAF
jgi:hypothetical protein